MKNIKKLSIALSVLFSLACLLLAVVYGLASVSLSLADKWFPAYVVPSVEVPGKEPLSVKDYVLNEVAKAGLNVAEVECLIKNESNWANDCNANKDLSTDCGIWRINSVHKAEISFADRLDYKKATTWSIARRLKDGNYNIWYGHTNGNCKSLAKK